ncbi:D-serine/D-alanine/glycine transporter [Brucella ceti TE28753-12]|uniref:Amino acid permease n=1 Tax=Brucella ceti M644/93/1 TaxID=520459 RepID=A0ABM9Z7X1_9HYPH|nr:D-serine/D-alanine/glycine transporter [Brucella ceti TE10759-12]AHB02870.1 D-serine/D-alanine/glycine transporter [Brucella ceti TE28753-12]EEX88354.1 amino acid permease [Brucella ceti M13/05/1]EEX95751.1 amino acid permease [Brucella ceti M644/93/1]
MNTISKPSVDLHREEEPHLARNLSNRHLQLIAIGGTIGTGLFMGSGKAVSLAGPSILLIYAITGFMLFFVMRALGEILLSNLQYRSFADFAGDYLGPCAQFFTGWTYWLCWIVTAVAEVVAVSGYVSFWFPHLAPWIPALGLITILLILNLPTVRNFGEIEFWFALIKIITIIGLIITGIYMLMTGFVLPNGTQASISPGSRYRFLLSSVSNSWARLLRRPKTRCETCRRRSIISRSVSFFFILARCLSSSPSLRGIRWTRIQAPSWPCSRSPVSA